MSSTPLAQAVGVAVIAHETEHGAKSIGIYAHVKALQVRVLGEVFETWPFALYNHHLLQ